MKHLKAFEAIKRPHVGSWVYISVYGINSYGQIKTIYTQTHFPNEMFYIILNDDGVTQTVKLKNIIYVCDTKEELETTIQSKKYNL